MRPEGQGCLTCRYCEADKVLNVEQVPDGLVQQLVNGLVCRRYPPAPMEISGSWRKIVPVVSPNDWCGEWSQQ